MKTVSGRLLGATLALVIAATGALAACYDVPEPDCGFVCGPDDRGTGHTACPDDYTCAADHRCHRNGAPANLVCASPPSAIDAPSD
ncbi:MAG TPA: hypothetical protein VFP84_29260 [Kofleriaceae bacterium]|nr:hypothetical protein [Kofleriaceae bacterium]